MRYLFREVGMKPLLHLILLFQSSGEPWIHPESMVLCFLKRARRPTYIGSRIGREKKEKKGEYLKGDAL